ncbi:peptidyl-tRNA hydrolase II [Gautieria morchelliformis]|nr:peptidyl-tRNA hydrolase II [Gautieria morchelliformis]
MAEAELERLTMQIVVRKDLLHAEGWGVGPLLAQTAHVATAVLHEFRALEETKNYVADLKTMRKTANDSSLNKLAALLSAAEPPIPYYLWVEQPENMPTCLALAPNRKEKPVKKALDKAGCRLWRA